MEVPTSESAAATASSDANPIYVKDINADTPLNRAPTDEERIQKAESFLRNKEIDNISTLAKRDFLEKKAGLSRDEVDRAMERVANSEGINMFNEKSERRSGHGGYGESYKGLDRGYEVEPHHGRYMHRDHRMYDGRSPYDISRMNTEPHYNNTNSYGNVMHHEDEPREKQGISFTSWAGGFSLGIFCLAALRWLNGGDFILFPPPTAAERQIKSERYSNEVDEESTEQEDETNSFLGDIQEGDEERDEIDDEALSSILNGTSSAQSQHPTENQPSYGDLLLEVRALTSAVNSYRDEQERTNRAAAAKVGKGVTDDVMGFLRVDKSKSKSGDDVVLSKNDFNHASMLLKELSDDLDSLKQRFGEGSGDNNIEDLLANIDSLVEKIQKASDCLQPQKQETTAANKDDFTSNELHYSVEKPDIDANVADGSAEQSKESEQSTKSDVTNQDAQDITAAEDGRNSYNHITSSSSITSEDSLDQNTSAISYNEEAKLDSHDVEQALRILSNENNESELKVGAQMLYLYCMNISKNPTVPRYRKIYTNNNTFQNKVGNLRGADELLSSVGFTKKTNFYEWAQPNDSSGAQTSLDLALVALDMMRKGTKTDQQEEKTALQETTELIPAE